MALLAFVMTNIPMLHLSNIFHFISSLISRITFSTKITVAVKEPMDGEGGTGGRRRRRSPRLNPQFSSNSPLQPFSLDSPASPRDSISGGSKEKPWWWDRVQSWWWRKPQIPQSGRRKPVRKLLVLDLDETLIHATTQSHLFTPISTRIVPSLRIEVEVLGHPVLYYIYIRPHVRKFLNLVSQWFDLAIYTASVQEYADPIIDYLERQAGIRFKPHQRFFRPDCIPVDPNHHIASHALDSRTLALGHPFGSHPYWKDLRIVLQKWRGSWRRHRSSSDRIGGGSGRPSARQRYDSMSSEDVFLSDRSHMESADDTTSSINASLAQPIQSEFLDLLLSKTILLDNSPLSFHPQPRNGLPVPGWINDPLDEALLDVLPILDALRYVDDVRHILAFRLIQTVVE
jgi:hypothetical protein